MPRLSDTMEEGELAKWLKNVGDPVAKGDVLAEIETDKATMDLEAFESGVLEQQLVEAGSVVPIGTPVAVIGDGSGSKGGGGSESGGESEQTPDAAESAEAAEAPSSDQHAEDKPAQDEPAVDEPAAQKASEEASAEASTVRASDDQPAPRTDGKLRVSPLARKIAKEHGIDLAGITGTGTEGRIIRVDVEAAIEAGASGAVASGSVASGASASGSEARGAAQDAAAVQAGAAAASAPSGAGPVGEDERVPANRLRSVAAKRLTESQAVPHFFLTSVVEFENLLAFRTEVNEALAEQNVKASVNDVIVRAVAVALRRHPEAHASWVDDADGQAVLRRAHVNVGIAVATDAGLLVPVIRDADRKSLAQIAIEAAALAEKARAGKLGIDEMTGGTFSVSNLGPFGIDQFTAVITPAEAASLAVGAATPVPVLRDGELVEVPKLTITLTVDHRVMDGAVAAGFLRDLVGILEQPLRMLL
jgi:pyruvate dehydrogenase E2 component (dihydrolipoamide acetyltransferase)